MNRKTRWRPRNRDPRRRCRCAGARAAASAAPPGLGELATLHRRLEERLASFTSTQSALLFGSGYLANLGVIPALARRHEVVFCGRARPRLDRPTAAGSPTPRPSSTATATRSTSPGACAEAEGRGALIVTEGVFGMDGDVAPLEEIVELARRHDVRVMVDEAHGTGAIGPAGRGATADAGLEGEVDVIAGSLGDALGSYGAYVACDNAMARFLINAATPLACSTGLPPASVAAAMAALGLRGGAAPARRAAAGQRGHACATSWPARASTSQARRPRSSRSSSATRASPRGSARTRWSTASSRRWCHPTGAAAGTSRLRLAVMASHSRSELRDAARILAQAALRNGFRPSSSVPVAAAHTAPAPGSIFDGDAHERLPRAA